MAVRRTFTGLLVFMALALPCAPALFAQEGGQFCARAFEDRNANGTRDAGEPLITRGISAVLMDAAGVVVASAILDNSPTAGQGVICFQGLAPQQYTMMISSAEFTATTADNLTMNVVAGELPPVLEFGGQRIAGADTPVSAAPESAFEQEELVERALLASLGALGAMLVTSIVGLFVYVIAFRGRRSQPVQPPVDDFLYRRPSPGSTGQMRAVHPTDTGEVPRQRG